jgi:hypothetical protein
MPSTWIPVSRGAARCAAGVAFGALVGLTPGHALVAQPSAPATATSQALSFDVLIRNGRVFDGTGNPAFPADIGIRGGRIVAVGRLPGATAVRIVDAKGKHVAPGFIDIHSHADDGASIEGGFLDKDPRYRAAPNLVTQGVTTVEVNHDGRSPWPIADQRSFLERNGIGPNALLMVGHGTVRARVMGNDFRRAARPDEIAKMQVLVRQAMREGAIGLSAGLEYVPMRWSTTDEVVALAREIVPFGGVYIAHQRAEGGDPMWYWPSQDGPGAPTLMDAVQETIDIGERTGARVVASHIKAKGEHWRGTSDRHRLHGGAAGHARRQRPRGDAAPRHRARDSPPRRAGECDGVRLSRHGGRRQDGGAAGVGARRLTRGDGHPPAVGGKHGPPRWWPPARLLDGRDRHGALRGATVAGHGQRCRHRAARGRAGHARALLWHLSAQDSELCHRAGGVERRGRDPQHDQPAGADRGAP